MNLLNERILKARPLIGTLATIATPSVVEALSRCGFDWLWIDMEHAPLSLEQVQNMIIATGNRCASFVRVPANDEVWIKRVLDLGANGIIVPNVKTAEEAQRAVSAAKYPPEGIRSIGMARAQTYGMETASYIQDANSDTAVILQIEHVDGVKNVDAILEVPGIDAIIVGPYDLSGSYGKLGKVQDRDVQVGIETILNACKERNIPIGIFSADVTQSRTYLRRGFQLVAVGVDIHYLWSAAKDCLESIKEGAGVKARRTVESIKA